MELVTLRAFHGIESTLGILYMDRETECFTLEDQHQDKKVPGETRIPAGRYRVRLKEVITPLTETYRKRFTWFTYHLEICEVPGFSNVYIHCGVTDAHTDACLLVGDALYNNKYKVEKYDFGALMYSSQAYERLYKKLRDLIQNNKEEVFIKFVDFVI